MPKNLKHSFTLLLKNKQNQMGENVFENEDGILHFYLMIIFCVFLALSVSKTTKYTPELSEPGVQPTL